MGKQETMIERVARALFDRKVEEAVCDGTWEENEALHDLFLADARASIEAMREPTARMIVGAANRIEREYGGKITIRETYLGYHAAIDAALNEDSGE